jgi:hypothetical protein
VSRGTLEHGKFDAASTLGGGREISGGIRILYSPVSGSAPAIREHERLFTWLSDNWLVSRTITAFESLRDATNLALN